MLVLSRYGIITITIIIIIIIIIIITHYCISYTSQQHSLLLAQLLSSSRHTASFLNPRRVRPSAQ